MKYTFYTFIFVLLVSCNLTGTHTNETYFGGQIINPKGNFVLLLKDDIVLDTLYLNAENKFIKSYSSIEEGLYTFKHGVEFQYVYLEPWGYNKILIRGYLYSHI